MKIGILGTAHSYLKAPFSDSSWDLWACNSGAPVRWDVWFQLHDDKVLDQLPGHREWLAEQTKPVYMQMASEAIPNAIPYPLTAMTAKYGTWFLTSTIAFMLALALESSGLEEIGMWGVDMAASDEYRAQKPGVRFFLQLARLRGIKVTVPDESEVMVPGRLYGYEPSSWLEDKARARYAELAHRNGLNDQKRNNLLLTKAALQGARDLTLTPDQLAEQLTATDAALAAAERDALVFDGGLQDMRHILNNWVGIEI